MFHTLICFYLLINIQVVICARTIQAPEDVTKLVGEDAQFTCVFEMSKWEARTYHVRWKFYNNTYHDIVQGEKYKIEIEKTWTDNSYYWITAITTLTIFGVNYTDAGDFTCYISQITYIGATAYLVVVKQVPKPRCTNLTTTVKITDRLTLSCTISTVNYPIRLIWWHDTNLLGYKNTYDISAKMSYLDVVVDVINYTDGTIFVCEVSSSYGNKRCSANPLIIKSLQVEVQLLPQFTLIAGRRPCFECVVVECGADDFCVDLTIQYLWNLPGTKLQNKQNTNCFNISINDNGIVLTCKATIGSVEGTGELALNVVENTRVPVNKVSEEPGAIEYTKTTTTTTTTEAAASTNTPTSTPHKKNTDRNASVKNGIVTKSHNKIRNEDTVQTNRAEVLSITPTRKFNSNDNTPKINSVIYGIIISIIITLLTVVGFLFYCTYKKKNRILQESDNPVYMNTLSTHMELQPNGQNARVSPRKPNVENAKEKKHMTQTHDDTMSYGNMKSNPVESHNQISNESIGQLDNTSSEAGNAFYAVLDNTSADKDDRSPVQEVVHWESPSGDVYACVQKSKSSNLTTVGLEHIKTTKVTISTSCMSTAKKNEDGNARAAMKQFDKVRKNKKLNDDMNGEEELNENEISQLYAVVDKNRRDKKSKGSVDCQVTHWASPSGDVYACVKKH